MTIDVRHAFVSGKSDNANTAWVRPSDWNAAHTVTGAVDDPLTTRGDLLRRDASAAARLALGARGKILGSDGTDPVWENGFATGLVFGTASAVSTLDFVLTAYAGLFKTFKFMITDILVSAGTDLCMRTSTDGGSSYDSAAASYSWVREWQGDTQGYVGDFSNSDTSMKLTFIFNGSGDAGQLELNLHCPGDTTFVGAHWFGALRYNQTYNINGAGHRKASADVDAVRFFPLTGTFSCNYGLWGMT